jgi:hypothetical protein
VVARSWSAALIACVLLATAGILLGLGFLTVAVMPQRRIVSGVQGNGAQRTIDDKAR